MSVGTRTQPPSAPAFGNRDMRDPAALGKTLLLLASADGTPPSAAYDRHARLLERVAAYDGGGLMSNDPALHHSKTPQTPAPGGKQ